MHTHPLRFFGLVFSLAVVVFTGVHIARAQTTLIPGLTLPFGGKVVGINPALVCTNPEISPIILIPARASYPVQYATAISTKRYSHFSIIPGSWILGLYSTIPDMSTCVDAVTGTPKPVIVIKTYGVGKSLGF